MIFSYFSANCLARFRCWSTTSKTKKLPKCMMRHQFYVTQRQKAVGYLANSARHSAKPKDPESCSENVSKLSSLLFSAFEADMLRSRGTRTAGRVNKTCTHVENLKEPVVRDPLFSSKLLRISASGTRKTFYLPPSAFHDFASGFHAPAENLRVSRTDHAVA